MKKPYRLASSVALLIFAQLALAQKGPMKRAEERYDALQYKQAIDLYSKQAIKNRETAQMWKHLGDAYYFRAQYEKAAPWYLKLSLKDKNLDMETRYRYAQVLKAMGNTNHGNDLLRAYYSKVGGVPLDAVLDPKQYRGEDSTHTLTKTQIGVKGFAYPSNFLGENTLLLTATGNAGHAKNEHGWTGESFSDLFSVRLDGNGDPIGKPRKMKGAVNTQYNEGSAVVTKDGQTLYFTRNNYSKGKLKRDDASVSNLKLFRATRAGNGKWKRVEELPFNDDAFSTGHPALSKDEKVLYFVSDRPGGKGKSDIYQVAILGDGFGQVTPLPGEVNTLAREEFPFVGPDSLLYFASDRVESIGGLDIFVATYEARGNDIRYNEVWHLGASINSNKDDFAYTVDAEGKRGFFATNRNPTERDEVFTFTRQGNLLGHEKHIIRGTVRDGTDGQPLENAKITFKEAATGQTITLRTDRLGRYTVTTGNILSGSLLITMDNYLPQELVQIFEVSTPVLEQDFYLVPDGDLFKKGTDIGALLDPVYFDLDSYEIRPDAADVLDRISVLMEDFPELQIQVRSHTDSRASARYNQRLSDQRADATVSYLLEKGIPQERISGKGYGESELVNDCAYGKGCSELEHAKNRRSEFIVREQKGTAPEDTSHDSRNEGYYTVQLGAFKKGPDLLRFDQVPDAHVKAYPDGYTRLFAGKFQSKKGAQQMVRKLKSKGYQNALVKYVI